jgi:hypothetical protein
MVRHQYLIPTLPRWPHSRGTFPSTADAPIPSPHQILDACRIDASTPPRLSTDPSASRRRAARPHGCAAEQPHRRCSATSPWFVSPTSLSILVVKEFC